MTSVDAKFPARYEPLERLGEGGGGEVWAARDRASGQRVALKLLREGADEPEVVALVREATALSGIEGLGVPRVLHFGRLPVTGRVYLVRELVEGKSLAEWIAAGNGPRACLAALADAADLLTSLHRSSLLHGDVKPANLIVGRDGRATLVDLGLAAPWREGGARPEGLTPRYAAPELFRGEALTPQAEVYALGASLEEILAATGDGLSPRELTAVRAVVRRAVAQRASERFPSADEFAQALRAAVVLDEPGTTGPDGRGARAALARAWTIRGIDDTAAELLDRVMGLGPGGGMLVWGPEGSGRSTLLRRVSWSLGVTGLPVVFVEAAQPDAVELALVPEMLPRDPRHLVLLVDDADRLEAGAFGRLEDLRSRGARLVCTVGARTAEHALPSDRTFGWFEVRPLAESDAAALVQRFIPSLGGTMVRQLLARSGGYPGPLRALVNRLEGHAVVSLDDLDRALDDAPVPAGVRIELGELHRMLDRGRLDLAAEYLAAYGDDVSVSLASARAKLETGRGEPRAALVALVRAESVLAEASEFDRSAWYVQKARAHLRSGAYEPAELAASRALSTLGVALDTPLEELSLREGTALVVDALAVAGLAQSLSGRHERAAVVLERGVELARRAGESRMLAVALGSLAFARQRTNLLVEAEAAYLEALALAEEAGDAGHVATTRLNLATLAHTRGDYALALAHLEAAVDMGRRSGRTSTVRQALFNLASLDLYLGRLARAHASLEALAADRASMAPVARAQLLALEAESLVLSGELLDAEAKCTACAEAYQELGRSVDAAEALLERILVAVRVPGVDVVGLCDDLVTAESWLADSKAHEALHALARGAVATCDGRADDARMALDAAIEAADAKGLRDWCWRGLVARAELHRSEGRGADEAMDRQRARAIVEAIAASLPRDLREVYWSDPRRRELRVPRGGDRQAPEVASYRASIVPLGAAPAGPNEVTLATPVAAAPREDRLAMLLEITRELAGEYDLDRLLERVTDRAVALSGAERGFVLLRSRTGEARLSIHAARERAGDERHGMFSRSIAERVVATGEPFLAVDAPSDERVSSFVSVHQLMLRSVACVPIRARSGRTLGALYLETRFRSGNAFASELPTLSALAEQSAIAIETARLVGENRERAQALELANRELEAARDQLEELLGRRTGELEETRRSLRTVEAALLGHFGYGGIVGTSTAMRRVYAVIERVKEAEVPVLITGESGTGKEVVARTIHGMGPRAKQKFVGVNCGAIPEHLLESELFGHVRGAFTGADREKKGLFRELDGGTILLDEIGEMPQKMQAGLLRVLQEKQVRPVGGTREEPVDVRVIAATHRNLAEMVARGTFREDLFYRLNVIELKMPALRERSEDVPLLVDHFLRIFATRYGRDRRSVGREAIRLLQAYSWPGNVRQLENVLLNAWILSDAEELRAADFELPQGAEATSGGRSRAGGEARSEEAVRRNPGESSGPRPESREDFDERERLQILDALRDTGWNRAEAARLLGIPRRTFYRRLKQYGIQ